MIEKIKYSLRTERSPVGIVLPTMTGPSLICCISGHSSVKWGDFWGSFFVISNQPTPQNLKRQIGWVDIKHFLSEYLPSTVWPLLSYDISVRLLIVVY